MSVSPARLRTAAAVFLCATALWSYGQNGAPERARDADRAGDRAGERTVKRAEETYEDFGYKVSIPMYESGETLSLGQMTHLADAYRLNHDTENAELWYAQVVERSDEPLHLLYYAQALQSNGRAGLAKTYFDEFDATAADGDERGERFARSIATAPRTTATTLRNETAVNGEHLDFSPAILGDAVVFVSTRPVGRIAGKGRDRWIDDNFMSLFVADVGADHLLGAPREFAPGLNTDFHEGPVSFDRTGRTMYFTRNTYNRGKRRDDDAGVMRLNVYRAQRTADGWTEATELPFNTDAHEEAHPALAPDGRTLYFASNRPGGRGGMDLYRSRRTGGTWGAPENLGPGVNTAGNDAFPFVHADGTLYFASDGRGGLGGLDIFALAPDADEPYGIGLPFNSPKDDFGYVLSDDRTYGYLTSARRGGAGKDDIYSFAIAAPAAAPVVQRVCVYSGDDADARLAGATVRVERLAAGKSAVGSGALPDDDFVLRLREINADGEYTVSFSRKEEREPSASEDPDVRVLTTDAEGYVSFAGAPGERYAVTATANAHEAGTATVILAARGAGDAETCVSVAPVGAVVGPSTRLVGVTRNARYDKVLPHVDLKLIDLCTGGERTARSDAEGRFDFGCVPCGCEFVIAGSKTHFAAGELVASTLEVDCAAQDCASGGVVEADLGLVPNVGGVARAPAALGGGALRAGSIIELKNIYYDFDESFIRDDARGDLDHVAQLLRDYPGMAIELGSHTDARGRDRYNARLAQSRADAARAYLLAAGIDGRRVAARGFGEAQLRNGCGDFVDCSEAEHQLNRRTEVKILRTGDEQLEVRYLGDAPERVDAADPARVFTWR